MDNYRSPRYPDIYYSGDGRNFAVNDQYQEGMPRKAPDFKGYQGYDRRKIPKSQVVYPKINPDSDLTPTKVKPYARQYIEDDRYPTLLRNDYEPRSRSYDRRYDYEYPERRDRSRSSERRYRSHSHDRDYFRPPFGEPSRHSWSDKNAPNLRGFPTDNYVKHPAQYGGAWPGGAWPVGQFDSYPPHRHRDNHELIGGRHSHKDRRRVVPKKPTRFLFLVTGIIMVAVGIAKALMAVWNHFYAALWTGFLIAIVGVIGLFHGQNYNSTFKSSLYVMFGLIATLANFVAFGLHVGTIVEVLKAVALGEEIDVLINNGTGLVGLTRTHQSPIAMDSQTRTYLSLALDIVVVLLLCMGGYVLTAVGRAASHFIDEKWDTYGECKPSPRKRPLLFNPFDQISLGQFCIYVGLVAEFVTFITTSGTTYWSPVWAGVAVIIAGCVGAVAGKWPHKLIYGIVALVMEFIAFAACIAGIALSTLGLYNDIIAFTELKETDPNYAKVRGLRAASIAGFLLADVALVGNFLFIVGRVVRECWHHCCRRQR